MSPEPSHSNPTTQSDGIESNWARLPTLNGGRMAHCPTAAENEEAITHQQKEKPEAGDNERSGLRSEEW